EAVTTNSAKIMGIEGYGLTKGCKANFNLLQARDPIEAIRLRAHRVAVERNGTIISHSLPVKYELQHRKKKNPLDEAFT
ncbi:MAG: cytosine deaminase, partial [Pseudomonadota bacterium]